MNVTEVLFATLTIVKLEKCCKACQMGKGKQGSIIHSFYWIVRLNNREKGSGTQNSEVPFVFRLHFLI